MGTSYTFSDSSAIDDEPVDLCVKQQGQPLIALPLSLNPPACFYELKRACALITFMVPVNVIQALFKRVCFFSSIIQLFLHSHEIAGQLLRKHLKDLMCDCCLYLEKTS